MAITVLSPASLDYIMGSWTHTDGDANESLAIAGTVWDARFTPNTSSGPSEAEINWSSSVSGRITTITIYNNAAVTGGNFIIWYTPS